MLSFIINCTYPNTILVCSSGTFLKSAENVFNVCLFLSVAMKICWFVKSWLWKDIYFFKCVGFPWQWGDMNTCICAQINVVINCITNLPVCSGAGQCWKSCLRRRHQRGGCQLGPLETPAPLCCTPTSLWKSESKSFILLLCAFH